MPEAVWVPEPCALVTVTNSKLLPEKITCSLPDVQGYLVKSEHPNPMSEVCLLPQGLHLASHAGFQFSSHLWERFLMDVHLYSVYGPARPCLPSCTQAEAAWCLRYLSQT